MPNGNAPPMQQRQRVGLIVRRDQLRERSAQSARLGGSSGTRPGAMAAPKRARRNSRHAAAAADRCRADRARTGGRGRPRGARCASQSRRPGSAARRQHGRSFARQLILPRLLALQALIGQPERRLAVSSAAPAPSRSRRPGRSAGTDCACGARRERYFRAARRRFRRRYRVVARGRPGSATVST